MQPSIHVFSVSHFITLLPISFFSGASAFYLVVVIQELKSLLQKKEPHITGVPFNTVK